MKVVDRIFEHGIWQQIDIDDMQFGFMKGKGATDAIFIVRQMHEMFRAMHKLGVEERLVSAVRKENEVALLWAEMRMCAIKLQDRVPSKGLRERLGLDDIISVLQRKRLRWYGHVLGKQDNDWVYVWKCMEYEVKGARPRGRPKTTWRQIVEKDCQAHKLNREDAMDCSRWRKQIRDD